MADKDDSMSSTASDTEANKDRLCNRLKSRSENCNTCKNLMSEVVLSYRGNPFAIKSRIMSHFRSKHSPSTTSLKSSSAKTANEKTLDNKDCQQDANNTAPATPHIDQALMPPPNPPIPPPPSSDGSQPEYGPQFLLKELKRYRASCTKCKFFFGKCVSEDDYAKYGTEAARHMSYHILSDSDSTQSSSRGTQQNITKEKEPPLKKRKATQSPEFNLPTSNMYEPLENMEAEENTLENDTPEFNTQDEIRRKAARTHTNKRNPLMEIPPIAVGEKPVSHVEFMDSIKSWAKLPFTVKYTKNNTMLYFKCNSDYTMYLNKLNEENKPYHTYTSKENRTHAFVVRGLPQDVDWEFIAQELEENFNIKLHKHYQFKKTLLPLYMLVTDSNTTLKRLKQEVKVLNSVRVTWELRRNKKPITQCRRCQLWGHSELFCNRKKHCNKCAGEHAITECTEEASVKCANCNGEHRSYDPTCPVYVYRLNKIPATTQYTEAPLPHAPAWGHSRQQPMRRSSSHNLPAAPEEGNYNRDFPNALRARDMPREQHINHDQLETNVNQVSTLFQELNTLKSLVNIPELLRAVRDLNGELMRCTNSQMKLTTFINFPVGNYNI